MTIILNLVLSCVLGQSRLDPPQFQHVSGSRQRMVHGQVVERSPTWGASHAHVGRYPERRVPTPQPVPLRTIRKPYAPAYVLKFNQDARYPEMAENIWQWGATPRP